MRVGRLRVRYAGHVGALSAIVRRAPGRAGLLAAVASLAVAVAAFVAPASAQAPSCANEAPCNDSYLDSLNLNAPGKPLNDTKTLVNVRDITTATVQTNILAPSGTGPAELTGCNGMPEGHTVWYDFFPQFNGLMQIVTSASFDTVIAVMPYNTSSLLPNNTERKCVVNATTNAQQLFVNVQAGQAYTVQIGGEGTEAGTVETEFNYVVMFPTLHASAVLEARPLSNGIQIVKLTVSAPRKASVQVKCTHGCSSQSKGGGSSVTFGRLANAVLPAGGDLNIYVTQKNTVGSFIQYRIVRGNFQKTQKCLAPNSKRPEACPS